MLYFIDGKPLINLAIFIFYGCTVFASKGKVHQKGKEHNNPPLSLKSSMYNKMRNQEAYYVLMIIPK